MKTFINWLKSLSSQQCSFLTLKIRDRYREVYWVAHQSLYVAVWMKSDFFKMEIVDFMAKYLDEMENPSTSERRAKEIGSVILPMYREITGRNYDCNLLVAYGIEKPVS